MNLRDIFLAGAFAQGGGGSVTPEQINQAVKDYLEENPVGEDVWEDVCDITTEEAVTSVYQELGAYYKKLRVWFAYQFESQQACQIWLYGNVTLKPGNSDRCQIGVHGYSNKTKGTLYTEFSCEPVKTGNYNMYLRKNYTATAFDVAFGEMTPTAGFANDPDGGEPYINGVKSVLATTNINAEFLAGARLVVKGVRA